MQIVLFKKIKLSKREKHLDVNLLEFDTLFMEKNHIKLFEAILKRRFPKNFDSYFYNLAYFN